MNRKRVCSILGLLVLFIALGVMYFSYPLMVMPDSTEYYGYLKIFYGQESMSEWNIVRGPSFPFVMFLVTLVFGNNEQGILIGTFIMFAIMVLMGWTILKKINFRDNVQKVICYIIYTVLLMFNPLVIGYMHGLLTEFLAIPMLFIYGVLAFKWINKDDKLWKKILFSTLLVLGAVFMWFVKQPYVFLALAPVVMAAFISIVNTPKLKNIIYRIGIILLSVIAIVISIKIWNLILVKNNVDMDTGRDTNTFIKTAVINGNTSFSIDFYQDHYEKEYIENSDLISEENKNEILKILDGQSEYKSFKLINVFKDFSSREESNLERKLVMFSKEEQYTTTDALKMYFKLVAKYPGKTINSYYMNYLALSDIVPSIRHKDANEYYPASKGGFYYENKTIGYSMYSSDSNMLWLNEDHYLYKNVKDLKTDNNSSDEFNQVVNNSFDKFNFIFKATMIIAPFLLVYLIIKIFLLRKSKRKNYNIELATILLGSSFIHLMFHTITGAIIDRYAIPVFPGIVISILIVLFELNKEKKVNEMKEQKVENKKIKDSKILVVIPAHNEEQNIKKVLMEIKKDLPGVDVLVINDSSTDNTKKIVEENNVKCISTIYNFKYAYAIQTGIKYAYQNDYDYVIQFDGDGQHIAKEAQKLLKCIEKDNCDIVIGSRYIEKGNYKSPFFRKIGTELFVKLIKIFCKKKITDPLSGFQCLNRRVIEKYAKMGEYPEYPDANLVIDMMTQGYNIEEVSVKMRLREFGESMHGGIIKPIKYMLVMFYTVIVILLKNTGKNSR